MALGIGFDRYAAWIRAKFEVPAWQWQYWRGAYLLVPFLVFGLAVESLDGGVDATTFIAAGVAGFLGHAMRDVLRWIYRRRQ